MHREGALYVYVYHQWVVEIRHLLGTVTGDPLSHTNSSLSSGRTPVLQPPG